MNYWQIIRARIAIIMIIFLLIVINTTVVSFLIPPTYMSLSRVSVEMNTSNSRTLDVKQSSPTMNNPSFIDLELEVIQSQEVLDKVVRECDLTSNFKRKDGSLFTSVEAQKRLVKLINIHKLQNTNIIEIRAYFSDPKLAQDIAQSIAKQYQAHGANRERRRVEIIKNADMPFKAVRPNIPFNIIVSIVAGLILGIGMAFLIERIGQREIFNAQNLLVNSGFNASIEDISRHIFSGGDVKLVVEILIKAKEKNINLSFEKACALDLQDKDKEN